MGVGDADMGTGTSFLGEDGSMKISDEGLSDEAISNINRLYADLVRRQEWLRACPTYNIAGDNIFRAEADPDPHPGQLLGGAHDFRRVL